MDSEYYDQVVKPLRRAVGPSIFYLCFTLARQRRSCSTLAETLGSAIAHLLVNVRFCQVRCLDNVRFRKVVLRAINVKF